MAWKMTELSPRRMEPVLSAQTAELLGPLYQVEQKNPPRRLFFAGDRALLENGPKVSIVGSRKASSTGLKHARMLAGWLARPGSVVVSGLAEGIDTAHHRRARHAA